jgi:hypothetical protein
MFSMVCGVDFDARTPSWLCKVSAQIAGSVKWFGSHVCCVWCELASFPIVHCVTHFCLIEIMEVDNEILLWNLSVQKDECASPRYFNMNSELSLCFIHRVH